MSLALGCCSVERSEADNLPRRAGRGSAEAGRVACCLAASCHPGAGVDGNHAAPWSSHAAARLVAPSPACCPPSVAFAPMAELGREKSPPARQPSAAGTASAGTHTAAAGTHTASARTHQHEQSSSGAVGCGGLRSTSGTSARVPPSSRTRRARGANEFSASRQLLVAPHRHQLRLREAIRRVAARGATVQARAARRDWAPWRLHERGRGMIVQERLTLALLHVAPFRLGRRATG